MFPVSVTCAPNGGTSAVLTRLMVVCAGRLRVMASGVGVQLSAPAAQVIVTGWLSYPVRLAVMVYVPGVTRFGGTPASCQVSAPEASAVRVTFDAPVTEYTADAGVVPAGGGGRIRTVPGAVPLKVGLRTSTKVTGGTGGGSVSVGELT